MKKLLFLIAISATCISAFSQQFYHPFQNQEINQLISDNQIDQAELSTFTENTSTLANNESSDDFPLPKFAFQVKWGDAVFFFQEVSGLSSETKPTDSKGGNSKVYSTVKMQGIQKYSNVTFKKGIFKGDSKMWEKYNQMTKNYAKQQITISLLDESQKPTITWQLTNAFMVKITGTNIKAKENEVVVESIEVAHEGLKVL